MLTLQLIPTFTFIFRELNWFIWWERFFPVKCVFPFYICFFPLLIMHQTWIYIMLIENVIDSWFIKWFYIWKINLYMLGHIWLHRPWPLLVCYAWLLKSTASGQILSLDVNKAAVNQHKSIFIAMDLLHLFELIGFLWTTLKQAEETEL